MTDLKEKGLDYTRIFDGSFSAEMFWIVTDTGERTLFYWEDIELLYVLSLQKKEEKGGILYLVFKKHESSKVHLIPSRHFVYRDFLNFLRLKKDTVEFLSRYKQLESLLEKESRRELAEDIFPLLVETFVHFSAEAFVDISVRDFLKGGASFVPKKKNFREIVDFRQTVEQRSRDPLYQKKEEETQEIGLKTWKIGDLIDYRYFVEDIFKGGMGVVYRVCDRETSSLYAVKMFQEQFLWDKRVNEMFLHEAQIWIELEKHENIVQALFVKNYQGCPALFLEFIEGRDLETEMVVGRLDLARVMDLGLQFCSGMAYANEKLNIVHRDIKPSNCLISKNDTSWTLKITDFGLVKVFDKDKEEDRSSSSPLQDDEDAKGTFAYMAPESFKSHEVIDTRADIYSFGIMLYEMLTGVKPIPGKNLVEYMKNHGELIPVDPVEHNPGVPADLSRIVMRCLEKDPARRFGSFRELLQTLQFVYREFTGDEFKTEEEVRSLTGEEWANKALSLAALGRHEEALRPFEIALEITPRNAEIWQKKGDSLVALNRLKDAIKCYDKAIMADHHIPGAWLSKGNALFQLKDYEKAVFCFNNALKVDPDNDEVWVKKGLYCNLIGSYQEAIECADRALRINSKLAQAWYLKSQAQYALENLSDALSSTKKALEENPLWQEVWHFLGLIYAQLRQYEDAVRCLDKYIEMNPEDREAIKDRSECLFHLGRFNEALANANEVLKIEKNRKDILEIKGDCLFYLGEKEKAISSYEQILEEAPKHPGALYKRGRILQELFYWDEARSCYESAGVAQPGDPLITYFLESVKKCIELRNETLTSSQSVLDLKMKSLLDSASLPPAKEKRRKRVGIFEKKPPETPEELKYAAKEAYKSGEYDIALTLFSRYLSTVTDDSEILMLAGDALSQFQTEKGDRRAADCYKMAVRCSPKNLFLWEKLMSALEKQKGKKADILTCLEQIIILVPEDTNARIKQLMLLEEIGAHYIVQVRALVFLKEITINENDPQALKVKGILLSILGRFQEAVKIFDRILKTDQKDAMALVNKGDILARMGEKQAALKCFMTASRYQPKDPDIFYLQGITYEDLEDLDKAIKSYDLALSYDDKYEMALVRKGFCLFKKGQSKESLDYYNKVLEENSRAIHAWEAKGLVMAIQGNFSDAEWCFDRALEEELANISVLKNKALLLIKLERYQDAIKTIETMIELDRNQYEGWIMKAECYYEIGNIKEAMQCCETAIENSPLSPLPWIYRGVLLNRSGLYAEALASIDRAISINPALASAHLGRGVTHFLTGKEDEAYADYMIALALDESLALAWYDLGLYRAHRNDLDEGIKCFDNAITADESLADAWVDKGFLQLSLRLFEEARTLGEKASQIDPRSHRAWFLQGLASACMISLKGESSEKRAFAEGQRVALKSYEKCMKLKEDYLPAFVAKRNLLRLLDRMQEAEECQDQIIALMTGSGTEDSSPDRELEIPRLLNLPRDTFDRYEFSMRPHRQMLLFKKES